MSSSNDNIYLYIQLSDHGIYEFHTAEVDKMKKRKNRERIGKLNNDNHQTSQSNTGRNTIQ